MVSLAINAPVVTPALRVQQLHSRFAGGAGDVTARSAEIGKSVLRAPTRGVATAGLTIPAGFVELLSVRIVPLLSPYKGGNTARAATRKSGG